MKKPATPNPATTVGSGNPNSKLPPDAELENMEGKAAPAFTLNLLDGSTVSSDQLKGKVVLLDFWATWCKYCVAATPKLEEWKKSMGNGSFEIYALNTTEIFDDTVTKEKKWEASRAASIKYRDEHKYTLNFAVYGDDLYEAWNIKGLPTLVLIDKQGYIAKTANKADAKTLAQFQLKIAELLRN